MIGDCVSQGYIGHNKNSKSYFKFKSKKAYLTGDLGYLDGKKISTYYRQKRQYY